MARLGFFPNSYAVARTHISRVAPDWDLSDALPTEPQRRGNDLTSDSPHCFRHHGHLLLDPLHLLGSVSVDREGGDRPPAPRNLAAGRPEGRGGRQVPQVLPVGGLCSFPASGLLLHPEVPLEGGRGRKDQAAHPRTQGTSALAPWLSPQVGLKFECSQMNKRKFS